MATTKLLLPGFRLVGAGLYVSPIGREPAPRSEMQAAEVFIDRIDLLARGRRRGDGFLTVLDNTTVILLGWRAGFQATGLYVLL